MEIYDKEKKIGYVVKLEPIEYNESHISFIGKENKPWNQTENVYGYITEENVNTAIVGNVFITDRII